MEFCSHLNGILFSPQWNFVLTLKSENTHKHWLFDTRNQVGNQGRNQVGNQVYQSRDNAAYGR